MHCEKNIKSEESEFAPIIESMTCRKCENATLALALLGLAVMIIFTCFRSAASRKPIRWCRLIAMHSLSLPTSTFPSSVSSLSLELPLLFLFLLPSPSSLDPSFSRSHSQPGVGWKIDQLHQDFAFSWKMMIAWMHCTKLIQLAPPSSKFWMV